MRFGRLHLAELTYSRHMKKPHIFMMVTIVSLLWLVGEAQAWVHAGPCRLHVYEPGGAHGYWQGQAKTDMCDGGWLGLHNEHSVTLRSCLQYNPGHVWVTLTCRTHSDDVFSAEPGATSMWVFSPGHRVPRDTWERSWASETADGHSASATSTAYFLR